MLRLKTDCTAQQNVRAEMIFSWDSKISSPNPDHAWSDVVGYLLQGAGALPKQRWVPMNVEQRGRE